jgi:amino acid transporter
MADGLWGGMGLAPGLLDRVLSRWQLLGINVSAMVGTGWVVAATRPVGSAAVGLSWLCGASAMFVLALVCAELVHALPTAGGNARYPHLVYGRTTAVISTWSYWLGAVGTTTLEALVATRSLGAITGLPVAAPGSPAPLNPLGLAIAALLLALFAVVNVAGIAWLARVNGVAAVAKIGILVVTAIALATFAFSPQAPLLDLIRPRNSDGLRATFLAVASSGIVFASLGFEQPMQFAREARASRRDISVVLLGSVWLTCGLYLLLQVTFFGAGITLAQGGDPNSPFQAVAGKLGGLGLPLFGVLLLVYGVVGTAGTGMIFLGASARLSYGAGMGRVLSDRLTVLNLQRSPYPAIVAAFALGLALLAFSQYWTFLLGFASSSYLISLGIQPLALGVLRRTRGFQHGGGAPRTLRSRLALDVVPLLAFVVANLLVLFATWDVNRVLLLAMPAGLLLLAIPPRRGGWRLPALRDLELRGAWWLLLYLPGIGAVSVLSSFGGSGALPFGRDVLATAVVSVVVYAVAVRWGRLPAAHREQAVRELGQEAAYPEPVPAAAEA